MNSILYIYLIIFLFSGLMGLIVLPRINNIAREKHLVDIPDERKVHKDPIPRLGGVCFLPITLMSIFLFNILCIILKGSELEATDTQTFLRIQCCGIGAILLYLVGVADDLVGVNYKAKFAAQIAAASLFPLCGLTFKSVFASIGIPDAPAWLYIPFTIFMVVYIINSINLIDGVDGLASGICIIAFGVYTFIFAYLHLPFLVSTCLSILGVLIVFFFFNVFGREKKGFRKLFMGDTGSLTLGYFISFLSLSLSFYCKELKFELSGLMYLLFAPLVIPLLDIVRVVYARFRDRVPLFKPDKRHIHHKLLRTGMSPHWVMISLLALSLYFIAINTILPRYYSLIWMSFINLASWMLMHYIINYFIYKRRDKDLALEEKFKNQKNTIREGKRFKL